MQALNEKLNLFGEWVIRLVLLNVLWIGASLLGLGILGIFQQRVRYFQCCGNGLLGMNV